MPSAPGHGLRRLAWTALLSILAILGGCSLDPQTAKLRLLESGNRYFERGKYKEAALMYRSALKKDRLYGEAYYRLALAELRLRRIGNAVYALRRAVELQPENEDARVRLADACLVAYATAPQGKREEISREIVAQADAVLRMNPASFDGPRIKGQLALLNKDLGGAVRFLEAADRLRPFDPNVGMALCQALDALGQFERGEQFAKGVIERHPAFEPIYDLLYRQYLARNRLPEAAQVLETKAANNFSNIKNILQLAQHYYLVGDQPAVTRTLDRLLANRQKFPNARFLVAEFYVRVGELQPALEQLREGARTSQGAQRLAYETRIAEVLIEQGQSEEAGRLLDGLIKANPKDPNLAAIRASQTIASGSEEQVEAEIRRLESIVRDSPRNPAVRQQLGRAYWARQRNAQALEQFKEAARLAPDYLAPRLALAQLSLDANDSATALQFAAEAVRLAPATPQARWLHAAALRSSGKKAQALQELRLVASLYPDSVESWLRLGRLELEDMNPQSAEKAYLACRERTQSVACIVGQSDALTARGQTEQAVQILRAELKARPGDRDLKMALGDALMKQRAFLEARSLYTELLAAEPGSAALHLRVGNSFLTGGDPQSALGHFQKAAELSPNGPNVLHYLMVTLNSLGRKREALGICERLLKLRPEDPLVLNNAAFLLAETGGDLDRALTYAQRATRAAPNEPEFFDTLGWVLLKKGLAASALEVFQQLVLQRPENPAYRYRLASIHSQIGQKQMARKEAEEGLRRNPSPEVARQLKDLLEDLN